MSAPDFESHASAYCLEVACWWHTDEADLVGWLKALEAARRHADMTGHRVAVERRAVVVSVRPGRVKESPVF